MTRIIPGVQVQVIKEVLPPQLAPSGVLGLVGLVEKEVDHVVRASSLSRFVEDLGPGTVHSMPEARQALANGVFELVASPVASTTASAASISFDGQYIDKIDDPDTTHEHVIRVLTLAARVKGTWGNNITVDLKKRGMPGNLTVWDLAVEGPGGVKEMHRNLTLTPCTPKYIADVLSLDDSKNESALIQVKDLSFQCTIQTQEEKTIINDPTTLLSVNNDIVLLGLKIEKTAEKTDCDLKVTFTGTVDNAKLMITQAGEEIVKSSKLAFPRDLEKMIKEIEDKVQKCEVIFFPPFLNEARETLSGGEDATPDDYSEAIDRLKNEPDVDMVLAAVQDFSNEENIAAICGSVISHCENESKNCHGRIGFGQVGPEWNMPQGTGMAQKLISDRFVLTAPYGVVGATAGMIGGLQYFQSPTFKRLSGVNDILLNLGVEDQRTLLKSHLVPIASQRERGIVVIHGLTTDGDQISVRRVADRAVRGVKSISELFIGSLNNENGRGALKQKLIEFLIQMEKEGAIVPKTDGSDPAYKVDVESSQDDFAKGIVRVNVAVRPVRAIDYIYATILVQV